MLMLSGLLFFNSCERKPKRSCRGLNGYAKLLCKKMWQTRRKPHRYMHRHTNFDDYAVLLPTCRCVKNVMRFTRHAHTSRRIGRKCLKRNCPLPPRGEGQFPRFAPVGSDDRLSQQTSPVRAPRETRMGGGSRPPSVKVKRFRGLRSENRPHEYIVMIITIAYRCVLLLRIRDTRDGTRCPWDRPVPVAVSFLAFFRLFGFVPASYTCGPCVNAQCCLCAFFFFFVCLSYTCIKRTRPVRRTTA